MGNAIADLITLATEAPPNVKAPYRYVDPRKPWKMMYYENCTARELQVPVIRDGKRVGPLPTLDEIRDYVTHQLDFEIWPEEQRFSNPHVHYLDMSPAYYEMKMDLLDAMDKH